MNKNIQMQKHIIITIILLFSIGLLNSQNFNINSGIPFVKNYKTSDYNAHEQNFEITQDKQGVMYFANFESVLIFDGVRWSKVHTKSGMRVLGLDVCSNGIVYVAGLYDFGFITKNEFGEYNFSSLVDSAWTERQVGEVFNVHAFNNKVYFTTKNKMYIYSDEKIEIIEFQSELLQSFDVNNQLFLFFNRDFQNENLSQNGLTIYKNNQFVRISDNSTAQIIDIRVMFYLEDTDIYVIGTESQGFFQMTSNIITPLEAEVNDFVKTNSITSGEKINNNLYVIGTLTQGILLVNQEGEIVQVIDKNSNLFDESVNDVYIDFASNIWVATNNGISLIELNNSLSIITNQSSGIEGKINKIFEYQDNLYCATSSGLFLLKNSEFINIQNFNAACWDAVVVENKIFIATQLGVFSYDGKTILETQVTDFSFCLLKSEKHIYVGNNSKITILEIQPNSTRIIKTISGFEGNVTKIVEDINGELFVEIPPGNIFKVNKTHSSIENLEHTEGFISLHINKMKSQIFFSSEKGIYNNSSQNLLDEYDFFKQFNNGAGLWIYDFFELDEYNSVFTDGSRKNITIIAQKNEEYELNQDVFLPVSDFTVRTLFFDKKRSNIWLGGNDGLIICDFDTEYEHKTDFKVTFSKIVNLYNDSLIPISTEEYRKINFSENSIRFEFASSYYPAKGEVLYSTFLDGFDKDFSTWTNLSYREFTNLPSGYYTFSVKAKDQFGNIIEQANFEFKILIPVYKQWWAILIYILLIAVLLKIFIDWRMKISEKEKEKLEEIIKERTAEIEQSKAEIEAQRDVEYKHRKEIMASIHYAKRIQEAVLPSSELFQKILGDNYFVVFKPQNVVSGDYFWLKQMKNFIVIAAADCTGHGVPGAFMSMLGTSFLNEIVTRRSLDSAAEVLERLRQRVKHSLHQEGKMNEQKDGMDIAIYYINTETYEMQFSGAYNSLFIVRKKDKITDEINNEATDSKKIRLFSDDTADADYTLIELRANRQPIGIYIREQPFDNISFKLEKNDSIYSFSDGYQDQFGGDTGEKFNSKRFKRLLLSIQDKSMTEQKRILEHNFIKWKGDLDQVDDVLVIGLKIDF